VEPKELQSDSRHLLNIRGMTVKHTLGGFLPLVHGTGNRSSFVILIFRASCITLGKLAADELKELTMACQKATFGVGQTDTSTRRIARPGSWISTTSAFWKILP
jgi:hypothetical protein